MCEFLWMNKTNLVRKKKNETRTVQVNVSIIPITLQ